MSTCTDCGEQVYSTGAMNGRCFDCALARLRADRDLEKASIPSRVSEFLALPVASEDRVPEAER